VVGEILDEFDQEKPPFEHLSESVIRVRGDVILEELEQHFNLVFEDASETNSIAGYIMSQLGSIPKPNERLRINGATITVEEVDGLAILTVIIQLPKPVEKTTPPKH